MLAQLEELIKDFGKLTKTRRAEDRLFELRTRCIPCVSGNAHTSASAMAASAE
jgi:hypothetical protein